MNKLFVIHYYPIDYFPPAMNLVKTLQEKAATYVISTVKSNCLKEFVATSARIFRPIKENKKDSSMKVLLKYCYFSLFSLWQLILKKPDVILYYESISALPVYLYKRFIHKKVKVCIHYHEYMTPEEYNRPGMRLSKYNHKLEISYLYKSAYWISQTNQYRKDFFLKDYPLIPQTNCHVLPNYPPQQWHVKNKVITADGILKCVYIGSLSLRDTYIKEFCEWVAEQKGKITFDVYSFNFHDDVKIMMEKIDSPYISFHEKGIVYSEIPNVLAKYDVGLLLYKANTLNVQYCETNKFYEYVVSGLDVWYTKEMTLIAEMDKSKFASNIQSFDVKAKRFPSIDTSLRVIDNSHFDKYCETVYVDFSKAVGINYENYN